MDAMEENFRKWKLKEEGREPLRGEFFESYIRYMYDSLLAQQAEEVTVQRRVKVEDTHGSSFEIDVLYEFSVAGVRHRVAIECKDTRRPIGRDDVIAFVGKVKGLSHTIGVFISRRGFQAGALKYLDDHGIEHFDGTQIPHFGQLLANRIAAVALPGAQTHGAPFWGLAETTDDKVTGNWLLVPDPDSSRRRWPRVRTPPMLFPLFLSKPAAEQFRRRIGAEDYAVRGISQPTLRLLTSAPASIPHRFGLFRNLQTDDGPVFEYDSLAAADIHAEYVVLD
ncbi:hypothetical protein QFZ53_001499 [Microbacterium natoriense]|uniref:Restriction endonuclease type IV Mrr domain-containing protein n=1 Tax=Microbacterium natoriense TaxID=284570 RepID=A0AAW8EVQ6_9MICO|nr:restriction endonuclease [Microbacterium natoriense]MDQ0647303.1 hypothetical protein [Microbacterium natoriense]